jgi:ubiquinone/menaquinone biosynthesis C-methylase UbiE
MNPSEYRRQFFERFASEWDKEITPSELTHLGAIFRTDIPALKPPLLDIGCGTGILIPFLRRKIGGNAPIVELDITQKMLSIAAEKVETGNSIAFIQADVQALPFCDQTFGSIVCFSAFPHFQYKLEALKEIYRCLANRGHFIVLHLMGHRKLNQIHKEKNEAVANDRMPAAKTLACFMENFAFSINKVRECATQYLIIAQK